MYHCGQKSSKFESSKKPLESLVAKEAPTKRQKRGRVIGGTDVRTNTEFPEYGAIWDQGNELKIFEKF